MTLGDVTVMLGAIILIPYLYLYSCQAGWWRQSGLRARDLAILAGVLVIYDSIATALLPLTTQLLERLAHLVFTPVLTWPAGRDQWLGIGLGSLLIVQYLVWVHCTGHERTTAQYLDAEP
jgi:hypothetical protein